MPRELRRWSVFCTSTTRSFKPGLQIIRLHRVQLHNPLRRTIKQGNIPSKNIAPLPSPWIERDNQTVMYTTSQWTFLRHGVEEHLTSGYALFFSSLINDHVLFPFLDPHKTQITPSFKICNRGAITRKQINAHCNYLQINRGQCETSWWDGK